MEVGTDNRGLSSSRQFVYINTKVRYRLYSLFATLYVFLSGFVFIEPGPSDILFILFLPLLLVNFSTAREIILSFLSIIIPMAISSFTGYVLPGLFNMRFLFIDTYLFTFFFVVSSFNGTIRAKPLSKKLFHSIMKAWILAGSLNILAGLFGYVTGGKNFLGTNIFFGVRLKGFFKDPNVLGPFLVPPAAYFMKLYIEKDSRKLLNIIGFLFFSLGVLLSFSRAAWLNYATTFFLLFIALSRSLKEIFRVLLVIMISVSLLFIFLNLQVSTDIFGFNILEVMFSRLGLQSYDEGRFYAQSQFANILSSTSVIFGTGPGNYEFFAGMATHSLFARYIGERGFFGLILFIFFFYVIFYKSARSSYRTFLIPVIIGQLVNSIFIDTLHWRHLWLLFSLVFM